MAHMIRPLIQFPRWHRYCCSRAAFNHLHLQFLTAPSTFSSNTSTTSTNHLPPFTSFPSSSSRNVHFRSRALKTREIQLPSNSAAEDSDSDSDSSESLKRSRNEKKRLARRAVKWGMQLANFSDTQIKRILRVASLQREVFEAIKVVQRLGRDVREGKRRQYNLIGKLLREVEPELMDSLIESTHEGDKHKFEALFGSDSWAIKDDDYEAQESESDDDDEDSQYCDDVVNRWCNGLINKDSDITGEIYSLPGVEFDRQELRRLVRRVHSMQDNQNSLEEKEGEIDPKFMKAQRLLTRFLRGLAKQISVE